jgi:hypothetical protein
MRAIALLLAALACVGCTHRQLSRSMLNQASTVMTIEYQMVLDNIAMFTYNPNVLPWAIRINDGTVQVNDEGGMAEFGAQWGSTPSITRAARAVRSVTEQWGAHPVTDPLVVKTLQDVYRRAIGLSPIPDPPLLAQLSASADANRAAAPRPVTGKQPRAATSEQPEELKPPADAAAPAEEIASGLPYESAPLARWRNKLDVPVGWFGVGRKRDVPKEACFVGHYCDNYVWVMPNHFEDLSHLTLIVLSVTKHGVSASQPSRGLDYVRR